MKIRNVILSVLIVFSFILNTINIKVTANATECKSNNVNLVVLFNDDKIDSRVKDIVVNNDGQVIKELPELGGIEVECEAETISKIKSIDTVL